MKKFCSGYDLTFAGGAAWLTALCLNMAIAQPAPPLVPPSLPLPAPAAAKSSAAPPVVKPSAASVPTSLAAPVTSSPPPAEAKILEVNNAAKVALVEGEVTIIAGKNQRRKVKIGDVLVEGESIVTGKDGELHLDMEDGGYIAIRPNTRMRIVKYQAKGDASDSALFGLLQGSFRSVTGWIGKFNREKYIVRTPNATIGIRGTDHEPLVIPAGSTEGEAGTYDKVNAGGSVIKTPQGRAEVAPNQAGFVPHGATGAPRLLKDVPTFFRATRNEKLLEGKHDAVQQRIASRREARKTEIKKRQDPGVSTKPAAPPDHATNKTANRDEAKQAKAVAQAAKLKAKQDADKLKAAQKAALEKDKQEKIAREKAEHANKAYAQHHQKL